MRQSKLMHFFHLAFLLWAIFLSLTLRYALKTQKLLIGEAKTLLEPFIKKLVFFCRRLVFFFLFLLHLSIGISMALFCLPSDEFCAAAEKKTKGVTCKQKQSWKNPFSVGFYRSFIIYSHEN